MRGGLVILLTLVVTAAGNGAADAVHRLQHETAHTAVASNRDPVEAGRVCGCGHEEEPSDSPALSPNSPDEGHSEHCLTCLHLRTQVITTEAPPATVLPTRVVGTADRRTPQVNQSRPPLRLESTGPPACLA